MTVSTLEEHPLYDSIIKARDLMIEFKKSMYPPTTTTRRVYPDGYPKKKEINSITTAIGGLKKPATALIKQKKEIEKTRKANGGTSLIKLKPDMAAFIQTEKKGLGTVYSNIHLTKFFTNYFQTHNLTESIYIIPDAPLIKLFREQFLENGIINEKGEVLTRKEGGKTIRGFKFIQSQRLFGSHIVCDSKGKRIPVNMEDRTIKPAFWEALDKEDKAMDEIKEIRKLIKATTKKLQKIQGLRDMAEKFGDKEDAQEKERELTKEIKRLQKQLQKVCERVGFPLD